MADTKISAFTDGTTADATDRIAAVRSPFGSTDNRYITPAYIRSYLIALANTWTATQTITPAANTNALAVTGYSLTGSNAQSLLDLAGTWNTTGTPTALKLNVTDTASNAASLLLDLQVGAASKFKIDKTGSVTSGAVSLISGVGYSSSLAGIALSAGSVFIQNGSGGTVQCGLGSATVYLNSTLGLGLSAGRLVKIETDAANILALRSSTSAQTLRVYYSYTDASNYTRFGFNTATGVHTIAAESAGTGEADIDIAFTPKGTGRVRFGTHSAIAAETVTGYITIKDSGGTERKVAIVS